MNVFKRRNFLPFLICLAVGVAAYLFSYGHTISYPFQYDDEHFVVQPAGETIGETFAKRFAMTPNRIVIFGSFILNHWLTPFAPESYRIANIAIHLVSAVFVYLLLSLLLDRLEFVKRNTIAPQGQRGFGANQFIALSAAIIFALHPLQTSAVTFVWQRCASLMGCFALASLWFYLQSLQWQLSGKPNKHLFLLSISACVLAAFCKANAIAIPFIALAMQWSLYRDSFAMPKSRQRATTLAATGIALPCLTILIGGALSTALGISSEPQRMLVYFSTQMHVLMDYLALVLWPIKQNLDYDIMAAASFLQPNVLAAFCFHLAAVAAALYWLTHRPLLGIGILFFYFSLATESSILPLMELKAEHRLYLALVGPLFIFAYVCREQIQRHPKLLAISVASLCIILSLQTRSRNFAWHSGEHMWADVIAKSPFKARGHLNYASALAKRGKLQKAAHHFQLAQALAPNDPVVLTKHLSFAAITRNQRLAKAIQEFNPNIVNSYFDFQFVQAHLIYERGDLDQADSILIKLLNDRNTSPQKLIQIAGMILDYQRRDLATQVHVKLTQVRSKLKPSQSILVARLAHASDKKVPDWFSFEEWPATTTDVRAMEQLAKYAIELKANDIAISYLRTLTERGLLLAYPPLLRTLLSLNQEQQALLALKKLSQQDGFGLFLLGRILVEVQDLRQWRFMYSLATMMIDHSAHYAIPIVERGNLHHIAAVSARYLENRDLALKHMQIARSFGYVPKSANDASKL